VEFDLLSRTVLFTIAGSRSYGLHTQESDVDVKGICIPPIAPYRLGILRSFEQADSREHLAKFFHHLNKEEQAATFADCYSRGLDINGPDGQIYDIKKFFKLALNANPNILEVLFCDDRSIRLITPAGQRLRDNRDLFLSKKAMYSYQGYAYSQMRRIKSHRSWLLDPPKKAPEREDYGLPPDRSTVSQDEQNAFLWLLAELLKDKVGEFRLTESTREELETLDLYALASAGIPDGTWPTIQELTGVPKHFIEAMGRERAYKNARAYWKSYVEWKKSRNIKRAELEKKCGYDSKHAMHLARLMLQGLEIIRDHTLTVYLPKEQREWLLWVRDGQMSFDELESWFSKQEKALKKEAELSTLRQAPKRKVADELLIELQEQQKSS